MLCSVLVDQFQEITMRIKTNPVLGTWEMAESERVHGHSPYRGRHLEPRNLSKLLIVDDEPSVRAVFSRSIIREFPDLEIQEADNGAEAADLFTAAHHGIILMDVIMPVMDGQTAFKTILKYCRDEKWEMPSVIFCTGYDPTSTVRKVVAEDSIHCMLQKPVTPKILIEAIRARL